MTHHTISPIATAATMGALGGLPFALHMVGLPSMPAYLLLVLTLAWSQVHAWTAADEPARYRAECDTGEIPDHQLDSLRRLLAAGDDAHGGN